MTDHISNSVSEDTATLLQEILIPASSVVLEDRFNPEHVSEAPCRSGACNGSCEGSA